MSKSAIKKPGTLPAKVQPKKMHESNNREYDNSNGCKRFHDSFPLFSKCCHILYLLLVVIRKLYQNYLLTVTGRIIAFLLLGGIVHISPRREHVIFLNASRVENWRSSPKAISPAPPRQTGQTVFPYTAFQSSSSRGFRFTWPSGIVPSEVPKSFGVYSVTAISSSFTPSET